MIVDQTSLRVYNEMVSCVIATHNCSRGRKIGYRSLLCFLKFKENTSVTSVTRWRGFKSSFFFVYYLLFQIEGPWQPHMVMTFYKVRLFQNFEKDNKSEFKRTY